MSARNERALLWAALVCFGYSMARPEQLPVALENSIGALLLSMGAYGLLQWAVGWDRRIDASTKWKPATPPRTHDERPRGKAGGHARRHRGRWHAGAPGERGMVAARHPAP